MAEPLDDLDALEVWESVPDALMLVSNVGEIRLANREACRLFGYESDMVGVPVDDLVPDAVRDHHRELRSDFHRAPRRRAMGAGMRLQARRRNGSLFPVQISLSPLGSSVVVAVRDISDIVVAEEQQVASARRRILAEDHERIAKDMHDTVIQELFAVGMSLQASASAMPDSDGSRRISSAVDTLDDVIHSIRALIFDIREDREARDDLRARVVEVATSLIPSFGFEPSVAFDGPVDQVPTEIQEHVLAVAREALTNVAKHAQASAASIEVQCRGATVTVRVSDDGVGVPEELDHRGGHANMAERARAVRGEFSVSPHPDGGTTVTWVSPVPGADADE